MVGRRAEGGRAKLKAPAVAHKPPKMEKRVKNRGFGHFGHFGENGENSKKK